MMTIIKLHMLSYVIGYGIKHVPTICPTIFNYNYIIIIIIKKVFI